VRGLCCVANIDAKVAYLEIAWQGTTVSSVMFFFVLVLRLSLQPVTSFTLSEQSVNHQNTNLQHLVNHSLLSLYASSDGL